MEFETAAKVAENVEPATNVATSDVVDDNDAHETMYTEAPTESYCDCLAPGDYCFLLSFEFEQDFYCLLRLNHTTNKNSRNI